MTAKPSDIMTLVELFAASDWDELHVEIDGVQLFLSTDPNARLVRGGAAVTEAPPTPRRTAEPTAPVTGARQPAEPVAATAGEIPPNWVAVTAPNLGTFYRAPKPGADPYVQVGQAIDVDTEVCLLEVMKLFTAVRAGVAGVVRRICVADAEMVEHGQPLFYVERA